MVHEVQVAAHKWKGCPSWLVQTRYPWKLQATVLSALASKQVTE